MSKEKKGARKPLRRAERWTAQVPSVVGRLVMVMVVVAVLGMMFSALQGIETLWLRALLAGATVVAMLAFFFSDGLSRGASDAASSRFCAQLQKSGKTIEPGDDAACYHPLKVAVACALVFALPLALAIYLCAVAKPYTYALQDLPTWLTGSYGARGDVMGPLGAYGQTASVGALGWLRAAVRITIMIFVNLFSDPLRMTGTIDRLAPLFLALYPAAYMLGYLVAPNAQRKREKENRRAKKVAVRKAQKSSLAKELIGEQNAVHYGQRAESSKHKRKELV